MTDLIEAITTGTMKVAASIGSERFPALHRVREARGMDWYCDVLSGSLRQVVKADINQVMDGLKEGLEANAGELWLRKMLNVECNRMALDALKILDEEVWDEEVWDGTEH